MLKAASVTSEPFSITMRVKPIGKGRARTTRSGHVYTPEATRSAEAEIRWLLQQAKAPMFTGAVALMVRAFFRRPKSAPRTRRHPTVKPDLSNVLKLIEDAGNGILYADDAQVVSVTVQKLYGDEERIELVVGEMP